jgi:lysyl-tRNA synthetase class 1
MAQTKNQKQADQPEDETMHWADIAAKKVIAERGDKDSYTVAAGITPSGVVHIGNCREIITSDLVARALRKLGKHVRFIYSWDDYDVFRKVPVDLPKQEEMKSFLRKPVVDTMDPWGCHTNYAEHNKKAVENIMPVIDIYPEYLYQAKNYRACKYAEQIREAMKARQKIREILDKFREEPLENDWLPLSAYCPKCGIDEVTISEYDEEYSVRIKCECGFDERVDFRSCGHIKLPWRIDWPMRWNYENVDFEPGGKDHSTPGGSRDTAAQIVKAVWNKEPPVYQMYDFVTIKGQGGKMSKSKGEVVTLQHVLDIYEPEVARYIFCGTRPNREFQISFDLDVLKIYADFDRVEQAYYGKLEAEQKDKIDLMKRVYEFCTIGKVPVKMPFQPLFRHLVNIIQIFEGDLDNAEEFFKNEIKDEYDKKRFMARAKCAKLWLENYAPDEFKFKVQSSVPADVNLSDSQKKVLKQVAKCLREKDIPEKELHNEFYAIFTEHGLSGNEFFEAAYAVLIHKKRGPQLASFILTIGKEKVAALFEQV